MVLEPAGGVVQAHHPKWLAQMGLYSLGTPCVSHRVSSMLWLVSVEVISAAAGQDKSAPVASPSLKKILEVASSRLSALPRSTTSSLEMEDV
jgi:hypothetical protein